MTKLHQPLSVTILPTCVLPLDNYLLSLFHPKANVMLNVFFSGQKQCLLLFTVHRTLISRVFPPHTSVNDYCTIVDCCPSVFFLYFFTRFSFCFLHVAHFDPLWSVSQFHCKGDTLHKVRNQIQFLVDIGHDDVFWVLGFLGGLGWKCFYFV